MSKLPTTEVMPERLVEHRAVRAWSQLKAAQVEPERIDILKLKNKSAVYRLAGVGRNATSVVAKRCHRATGLIERLIHEEFLTRLPLPALRCYGFVEEPDGEFCWLFLEEATGEYLTHDARHRALAGRWLGTIQRAAMDVGLADRLPSREPGHYLDLLRDSRIKIGENLGNPALAEADLSVLRTMISQLDVLESHWDELLDRCRDLPRTLVHGDFVAKNVRVRTGRGDDPAFLVFDWEIAGWGVPATDLAQFTGRIVSVDLEAYRSALEQGGTSLDMQTVKGLAECGRIFRLLDDINWACACLAGDSYLFLEKPVSLLRSYGARMTGALRDARWTERACATSLL
jgi:hypothetical protein